MGDRGGLGGGSELGVWRGKKAEGLRGKKAGGLAGEESWGLAGEESWGLAGEESWGLGGIHVKSLSFKGALDQGQCTACNQTALAERPWAGFTARAARPFAG